MPTFAFAMVSIIGNMHVFDRQKALFWFDSDARENDHPFVCSALVQMRSRQWVVLNKESLRGKNELQFVMTL